ncbi:MAG TPA: N-acetyl-gamma-glutamyl-phosphate reductase [Thermodesulfobium narugense]|nr:MAG: N-acetyl-gamma-glutamyl-phosphate reductase [Thermodesulfobium narugense]HEM55567.1 N-acetyl-gamma-glutamyl-phosphate reductase [Thermodesulfobium narugense]
MKKIKVGIFGATGYAGLNIFRILSNHPYVDLKYLSSRSYNGESYKKLFPSFNIDIVLKTSDPEVAKDLDACFIALPAGETSKFVTKLIEYNNNIVIIDLGADFRFKDKEIYEKTYGIEHSCPEILKNSVYGLPEINREKIKRVKIIGNPGCYPTSILLGLYPIIDRFKGSIENIIADSKSGVSGAGRKLSKDFLFCEVNESVKPYGAKFHRHQPEMNDQIKLISKDAPELIFTPHLIPMQRGILSTIYVFFKEDLPEENEIKKLYYEKYRNEKFIQILENDLPTTGMVRSSNLCAINICKTSNRVIKIFSAIDNLIKGASGQAVQNLNIIFDFPEELSLTTLPEVI